MKATIIAWTTTNLNQIIEHVVPELDLDATDASALAEFAGRSCYQSFSKPNPATATNADYLRHILQVGHDSVLRHGSVTFYIEDVSRSLTHELIRHHVGTAYSQLSQRYVPVSAHVYDTDDEPGFVTPPAMRGNRALEEKLAESWLVAVADYSRAVDELLRQGKSRKEAREAARAFLPNCAATKITVTGNHEALRNFVVKRGSVHADAEIRELAVEILRLLKLLEPNLYQDLEICRGGDGMTTVCQRPL